MEQSKQQGRKYGITLRRNLKSGKVSWTRILETGDYDELVYKLTSKYLIQGGYDRGYNKFQELKLRAMIF